MRRSAMTALSAASSISGCLQWLLDSIVGFLKSPPYTVPVMSFIDDNCAVFDAEEENKFSYTDIHNVRIPPSGR